MKNLVPILIASVALSGAAMAKPAKKPAAKKSAATATRETPESQRAPKSLVDTEWLNAQQLYLFTLKPENGWTTTSSGLRWRRVKGDGSGAKPLVSDTVTVHYTGTFIGGDKFDSSVDRGEPATFPLGKLIKGWQEAIPLMGVGDKFEIAVPMEIAYGPTGKGPIPPGATLLFTIELLGIAK